MPFQALESHLPYIISHFLFVIQERLNGRCRAAGLRTSSGRPMTNVKCEMIYGKWL